MTFLSNTVAKELAIGTLRAGAFLSEVDGCVVVMVRCVSCATRFLDELSNAEAQIVCEQNPLCLKCDDLALEPSCSAAWYQLVVQM